MRLKEFVTDGKTDGRTDGRKFQTRCHNQHTERYFLCKFHIIRNNSVRDVGYTETS